MSALGLTPYLLQKHGHIEIWQIDGPYDTHATYTVTPSTPLQVVAWKREQAILALGREIEKQKQKGHGRGVSVRVQ